MAIPPSSSPSNLVWTYPLPNESSSGCHAPHYLFTEAYTAAQTIGILSRMKVVVSMRLHGLIFAGSQGVPLVGIVYDQKVSSFLSYIGQDLYEDLNKLSEEKLKVLIDGAISAARTPVFFRRAWKSCAGWTRSTENFWTIRRAAGVTRSPP